MCCWKCCINRKAKANQLLNSMNELAKRYENQMKQIFTFIFLCFSGASFGVDKVEADINCDGNLDSASIVQTENRVTLSVTLSDGSKSNELSFGLGKSGYQDALCGNVASLELEELPENISEELGENPIGYKALKNCSGLNLNAGECDSIHVFWNHETKMINWWRL
jgi:hypothetical protein